MDIEEHLAQHEVSLRKLATKIAKQYSVGRDKDILYQAGVVALMEVHRQPGYDHDKSNLLTYANRAVNHAMNEEALRSTGGLMKKSKDALDHSVRVGDADHLVNVKPSKRQQEKKKVERSYSGDYHHSDVKDPTTQHEKEKMQKKMKKTNPRVRQDEQEDVTSS